MRTEKPYRTLFLLAIEMVALSVTICELFAVEMCIILTPTFRIGQGQMQISQSRIRMWLYSVLNIATLPPFARKSLPIYSIRIFILKMKVKDLDENWLANVPCEHTFVRKK